MYTLQVLTSEQFLYHSLTMYFRIVFHLSRALRYLRFDNSSCDLYLSCDTVGCKFQLLIVHVTNSYQLATRDGYETPTACFGAIFSSGLKTASNHGDRCMMLDRFIVYSILFDRVSRCSRILDL